MTVTAAPLSNSNPEMTKPFALCSFPDLALEICLAARAAECSALDAATAALLLPRLTIAVATEAVLQRHPLGERAGVHWHCREQAGVVQHAA